MSSPSQRRGGCGHMMAGFDHHTVCARCRDKKKGSDPCVKSPPESCDHCDLLTPEQRTQLSTPSYKLKKERKEAKSSTPIKDSDTLSPTLVDPALVSVVGVVDGQGTSGASGLSGPEEKRRKSEKKSEKKSASKSVKPDKSVKSPSRPASSSSSTGQGKSTAPSTDSKLSDLDKKWSDRFNRLEALLMAKTLDRPQEPVFGTVKVTPSHAPPADLIRPEPFIQPTTLPQPADTALVSPATDPVPHGSSTTSKASSSGLPELAQPRQKRPATAFDISKKDASPSSDSESDSLSSDHPLVDIFPEKGELSDDMEANASDHDQSLSEEQSYRETMRGIRSFMNWSHIPDIDTGATTSEDNPFSGPKMHTPGKVSVSLPTDEWLCKKLSKLNLTLTQGYPTRASEAGGLLRDQFVRPPKSQTKWYGCHPNPKKDSDQAVTAWHTGSSRLNSGYLRIARQAGIASAPPMSRPISQENLRKWEKSARESTIICNQAAGFNRCLLKVQQNMGAQLKAIRVESKGKAPTKASAAVDELQFLLDFNASVCQSMAKAVEHLTEFVFVNMANATLLRRDSYLAYLKAGVKADTLNALRTSPLHVETLFPDSCVKKAEEDITDFDRNKSGSVYKGRRYHLYERQEQRSDRKQDKPAWKNLSRTQRRKNKGKQQYSSRPAKGQQQYK